MIPIFKKATELLATINKPQKYLFKQFKAGRIVVWLNTLFKM